MKIFELPREMLDEILVRTPTSHLKFFGATCKAGKDRALEAFKIKAFLAHVARRDHKKVISALKKFPELAFKIESVTDYSDRTFVGISAIHYAGWCFDIGMLKIFEQHIPASTLLDQLQTQEEVTKRSGHGTHYSEEDLLKAYGTLAQYTDRLAPAEAFSSLENQQSLLPVHVIHEILVQGRKFDDGCDFTNTEQSINSPMLEFNHTVCDIYRRNSWFPRPNVEDMNPISASTMVEQTIFTAGNHKIQSWTDVSYSVTPINHPSASLSEVLSSDRTTIIKLLDTRRKQLAQFKLELNEKVKSEKSNDSKQSSGNPPVK